MASAIVRSAIRGAVRARAPASKRNFSSSAHHDDAREAAKWEKISYVAAGSCTIFAIYNLSKEHPHYDEAPKYAHMHIRNKEFPWGPDGLFERKHH
ncbi:cytochrome c oxidase subunit 6a, mitochondrial-like [Impatiens glandulifera]|uniref:cytochrome c oxidase subunit 6a, mitochondrial-like n=1 Tax=Impatiens glandulifera TaxID=253017 RepID=UPI001FB0E5C0|nr:cytochrome c oxidase subunit 6a, mitochondrial-like [Impatiens glandulifera]